MSEEEKHIKYWKEVINIMKKQEEELISEFLEFLYKIDEDYPVGDEIEKWEMRKKELIGGYIMSEGIIEFYMRDDPEGYKYNQDGIINVTSPDGITITKESNGWYHIKIDLEKIKK